jgi:restriction endonuclease Mrr
MKPIYVVELPSQSDVERQLLCILLLQSDPVEPKNLYEPLADHFGLTTLQRTADLSETNENAWRNRVRHARWKLVKDGFLDDSSPGHWSLTPAGQAEARKIERSKTLTPDDLGL